MGQRYSVNLYFPAEQVKAAFEATANTAELTTNLPDKRTLPITLPNGEVISLPFTSHFRTDPLSLRVGSPGLELETTLLFSVDEEIRWYSEKQNLREKPTHLPGKGLFAPIGYIYLTVTLGKQYAEFSFTAATSRMSELFFASSSIQKAFLDLLYVAGGLFGLIEVEEDYFYRLSAPEQKVMMNLWEFYPEEAVQRIDVDGFIEALKQSKVID